MRNSDNMRAAADGVEAMGREEAAYWLGMAMHHKRPRRVPTAFRILLTEAGTRTTRKFAASDPGIVRRGLRYAGQAGD